MGKKIWFKRKLYGWGWTPSTWQGWAVLGVWFVLMLAVSFSTEDNAPLKDVWLTFLTPVILLTVLLIAVCYKYGEKPRWQWGKDLGDGNN